MNTGEHDTRHGGTDRCIARRTTHRKPTVALERYPAMNDDGVLKTLERWSSTLYLVAGGLLVGNALLLGYEAFVGSAAPEDVLGPPGFLVGFLGLFGLYAALAVRTPKLARAAAVVAVVAAGGWAVITPFSVGGELGSLAGEQLPMAVVVVAWVATILAYSLFGAASLRSGVHSRTVGLLLFSPAVLIVTLIVGAGVFGGSAVAPFLVGSGQALAHLAIGYALRTEDPPAATTESRADSTA